MDKKDILKNLQEFLQNHSALTEKCEVVYLMVEIRKILETKNNSFGTLRFYCNWVIHNELSWESSTKYLSKKLDKDIDLSKSKNEICRELALKQKDFFKLNDLRLELIKFLKNYELTLDLLTNNNWYKFIRLFLEIIMECPVICNPSKIQRLDLEKDKDGFYYRFTLSKEYRIPRIKLKFKQK